MDRTRWAILTGGILLAVVAILGTRPASSVPDEPEADMAPSDRGSDGGQRPAAEAADDAPGIDPRGEGGATTGEEPWPPGDRQEAIAPPGPELPEVVDAGSAALAMRVFQENIYDRATRERLVLAFRAMLDRSEEAVHALAALARSTADEVEAHNAIVLLGRSESQAAALELLAMAEDEALPERPRYLALRSLFQFPEAPDGVRGKMWNPYLSGGGLKLGRRLDLLPRLVRIAERGTGIKSMEAFIADVLAKNEEFYEPGEENLVTGALRAMYARSPDRELRLSILYSVEAAENATREHAEWALGAGDASAGDKELQIRAYTLSVRMAREVGSTELARRASDALLAAIDEETSAQDVFRALCSLRESPIHREAALRLGDQSFRRIRDAGDPMGTRREILLALTGFGRDALPTLRALGEKETDARVKEAIDGAIRTIEERY